MGAPEPAASTSIADLLQDFDLARGALMHILIDRGSATKKKVIYNFDYNLLYPWIWFDAETKDPQYDLVGRNIMSLFPHYASAVSFKFCLTIPSVLELLDTIEHRFRHYTRLRDNSTDLRRLLEAFRTLGDRGLTDDTQDSHRARRILLNSNLLGGNNRLDDFIKLFKAKSISFAHEHLDMHAMLASNSAVRKEYKRIFDQMDLRRGRQDPRSVDDRRFHYRVDAWNLAFWRVNSALADAEVNYICRGSIREYSLSPEARRFTRHPMVPMYQLYALLTAAKDSDIRVEEQAFLEDGLREVSAVAHELRRYGVDTASKLSAYLRNKIDEVHRKFIIPLFMDFSKASNFKEKYELEQLRLEALMKSYQSITTIEGFQERFNQRVDVLKGAAQDVISVVPQIRSPRLREPYDLSDDPRVQDILRSLNLE